MDGSRPRRSTRVAGPGERRPGLPLQRSRRDENPRGVGWWQPPKGQAPRKQPPRGAAPAPDAAARHRVPEATDVLPVALAPARRGRPGRRRSQHQRPLTADEQRARRLRLLRRGALGAAATVVLGPLLAFAVGYLAFSVPSTDAAVDNQVALVSYADGSQLARLVPEEGNRIKVPIEQVPLHVRHAVLAAEDRTFYSNPGFDLTGIMRAAWNQLRGGEGGGSTITQQFVKKALVGDEQTLWRKYKEVILAVKISQERSKDEILADYLNTIYLGRGAYGIQSASNAYFRKDVSELSPTEGALLAGLIQSPSRWDPAVSPERAVERWSFVLDGMLAQGWMTPAERAGAQFPQTAARRSLAGGVPTDSRGHIVTAVTAELEELGFTEQNIAQEGLRITTTVDPRRQQLAVDAAHTALDGQPVNLRSAMVAIDPATGGVLAYYGGDNGLGLDYAQVRKLAGSTFKPFVVLAGLLQDPPVGLGEVFDGTELPGLRNAAGADCLECDLKQAMTVSNNVVFHTLARQVGPDSVAAAAHAAGITAPLEDPTAGIALGNKEVSALELASAYATIAAGGVWRQPHLVASVVTTDNRVLYDAATEGERRFPERVARNVTEAMLNVAENDDLALPGGRPVAAKTGTVQSRFEGENNDAWMSGFTPALASTVWMGTDMNSPIRTARGTPIQGSSLPGDVWHEFMSEALEDAPIEEFPPFRAIGDPPSPLGPNEEPEPPPVSTPPTPAPGFPPPGPPSGPAAPGAGAVAPTAEPPFDDDGPRLFEDPDSDDVDRDGADRGTDDENEPEEDCSVTPCG
ncbi:transglycosylase domain-containing protein [Pseudonocardia sp. MH-G8]|uniref:transglycosylase domain-containing protein n=1 Tax=Pseudonocardia sp. MH-G8 TaxID=1854588 RepID=UPI0013040FD9|nr:transglycosylase domain-containing protein [Pseudonocardia sp. MH-G8]